MMVYNTVRPKPTELTKPIQTNHREKELPLTTDTPILNRVSTGDETAVADCLKQYGGLVWSLARRFCPDHQTAEDAVQDIFMHIWQVAEKFDATLASETTYIAMIARRRLIDMSRRKSWKLSRAAGGEENQFEQITAKAMRAEERIELNDEAAKAAQLLKELPEAQQQVLRLSIYEGLSHSRIASHTGLSLGTVKTHIRRGLSKLRESIFQAEKVSPHSQFAKRGAKS